MNIDQSPILRRDPGHVGAALTLLADQLVDGWRQAQGVSLPESYRRVHRMAVCAMGGSHLPADIIKAVLSEDISRPIMVVSDYQLPAWVDQETAVIAISYSGTPEETIAALKAAIKRRAKVAVITSGGALADAAGYYRLPLYQFTPTANPSGQPRLGIGYTITALLMCLRQLGWLRPRDGDLDQAVTAARQAIRRYHPSLRRPANLAKQLAVEWRNKIPLLMGTGWTAGNLQAFHNQIHENAKTWAAWYQLPDLNHHLLEGLRHRAITRQLAAWFVDDPDDPPRLRLRLRLTAETLGRLGATVRRWRPHGHTRWEKAIDMLAFGGFVSWYLAAVRRVQPAPIPTVDALKQALGRVRKT
ncbi:MAG: SIS domain-containing protein [Candidatus Kerfeldbacteria bacterium]|nr:SIS domain-containing protein [Candidatus Kerfeldbacteria bacterium]